MTTPVRTVEHPSPKRLSVALGLSPRTASEGTDLTDDTTTVFEPIQTRRAFDDIIDQIRGRITSGDLRPGDKLPSERDFSEQLGVSRNTVREAIRMLEISGLVIIKKGATGGAFIASSNEDALTQGIIDGLSLENFSLYDLMEARIALETKVAARATELITDEEIAELVDLVDQVRALDHKAPWSEVLAIHLAFEEKLLEIAGNPLLTILTKPILELTGKISRRLGPRVGAAVWDARASMLEAMKDRDSARAAEISEGYLRITYEQWIGEEED